MSDIARISFCPRCGQRFPDKSTMQVHLTNCTDINEEYRGEIDGT